jgi:hypothetical protein
MTTMQRRWMNGIGGAPAWVGQVLIAVALLLIAAGSFLWLVGRDDGGSSLKPDELAYSGFMAAELDTLSSQLTETGYLLQRPEMDDATWQTDVARGAEDIRASALYIAQQEGAGRFTESDKTVDEAMRTYLAAMGMVDQALATSDEALIRQAFEQMRVGGEILAGADTTGD